MASPRRLPAILLLLLLLSACAEQQLVDENVTPVQPPEPEEQTRPEIPRTEPPEPEPLPTEPPHRYPPQMRSFLNATTHTTSGREGLYVGDQLAPFLIGDRIGELLPLLRRGDLAMLTTQQPTYQGGSFGAESYLRFDFDENSTGELRYVEDPEKEEPVAELFFAEERPMFEYAYLLQEGAFPAMEGSEIDFFGDRYVIHEATQRSLTLYGLDTERYLYLINGSGLRINGDEFGDTEVYLDPWHVTITYYAEDVDEDGIRLHAGEGLRDKLTRPEILLNPLFDIRFDGMEGGEESMIRFDSREDELLLHFTNLVGDEYCLPLLSIPEDALGDGNGSILSWGSEEHPFHFTECERDEFCVGLEDRLLFRTLEGVNRVMEFRGASRTELRLRDLATEETHSIRLVDSGDEEGNRSILDGTMGLHGFLFRMRVLNNETPRLSADLDGDERIGEEEVTIVTPNAEIELERVEYRVELLQPETPLLEEERIGITFAVESGVIAVSTNITLTQVEDEEEWQGMTRRGALLWLEESSDGVAGEELLVSFPRGFRGGIVRIIG